MALCRAGCGFWGNEAFDGMCSVCFKKQTPSTRVENVPAPTEQSIQLNAVDMSVDSRVGNISGAEPDAGSEEAANTDIMVDGNTNQFGLSDLMQRLMGTEGTSNYMSSLVELQRSLAQNDLYTEEEDDMYSDIPSRDETQSEPDVTSSVSTTQAAELPKATEAVETEKSEQRSLCQAGCGFYSNHGLDGLCSMCFKKEKLSTPSKSIPSALVPLRPAATMTSVPKRITSSATVASASACPTPQPEQSAAAAEVDEGKGKRKKNRCITCKKNVGLLGFPCRCGGLFCGEHRYSDKHECKFDYKAQGKEDLTKQMMTGGVTRKFKPNAI